MRVWHAALALAVCAAAAGGVALATRDTGAGDGSAARTSVAVTSAPAPSAAATATAPAPTTHAAPAPGTPPSEPGQPASGSNVVFLAAGATPVDLLEVPGVGRFRLLCDSHGRPFVSFQVPPDDPTVVGAVDRGGGRALAIDPGDGITIEPGAARTIAQHWTLRHENAAWPTAARISIESTPGPRATCGVIAQARLRRAPPPPPRTAALDDQPAPELSRSLTVSDSYAGVSCRTANSIACDRIGVAVWLTRADVQRATLTLGGRRLPLTGRGQQWTAFVPHAGLRAGPLRVPAVRDRWLGADAPTVRGSVTARFADGHHETTAIATPLHAGWG